MDPIGSVTMRRVGWRLLPLLIVAYLVAYVDRVNVGFAALQMNKELGFNATVYGWGAGIFFIGYFLFEVPSNLALERVGARRWLARIMVSWGILAAAMAAVGGVWSFTVLRFLLGAAEAGFFPGVILFLTYWFPAAYRARIIAMFMVAIPLSSALGSPISGALLGLDWLGLHGWQWMFLLEALPAILVGLFLLLALPDRPENARWLNHLEREWLVAEIALERPVTGPRPSLWRTLSQPRVLLFSVIYFGVTASSISLSLWTPQIIKAYGLGNLETGLLNSVPYAIASVAMIVWGRRSDLGSERRWHAAIPCVVLGAGLLAGISLTGLAPLVCALAVAACGAYMVKGPFWAFATEGMTRGEAAAGIATVNAIGNLAGFVGPYAIGAVKSATGSFELSLIPLVVFAFIALVLTLLVPARPEFKLEVVRT